VPTEKGKRAFLKAVATFEQGGWRELPPKFVDDVKENIYKHSQEEFGGMWVDAFRLIEISCEGWSKYEGWLKKGLLLLARVANGGEHDGDCVSWSEFNIIVDIVQPSLAANMRMSLFYAFSEAAIKKEGREWEGEALAEVSVGGGGGGERSEMIFI
jgi:hypothetical protein